MSHNRSIAAVPLLAFAVLATGCEPNTPSNFDADTGRDARSGPDTGPSDTARLDAVDGGDAAAGLNWEACYSDYECTDVDVPVDYDQPNGETMTLRVIRKPAANESERIGTVMLNFGGPGVSGVNVAGENMFPALPVAFSDLHKKFDAVAVEPRGAAKSTPNIDCASDSMLENMRNVDPMPDGSKEWQKLTSTWQAFVDGCLKTHSKGYLAQVHSENIVRDMETVRAELGAEKINYVGISYGTYTGALYANRYPDRVRAFVLDSNTMPQRNDMVQHLDDWMGHIRTGLEEFVEDCANDDSCAFHGGEKRADVESALKQLFSDLEQTPVSVGNGRELSVLDATTGLVAALRSGAHEKLADALSAAESGNGSPLLELSDSFWRRGSDGSYGSFIETYLVTMFGDTGCPANFGRKQMKAVRKKVRKNRPILGYLEMAIAHACTVWPEITDGSPDIGSTDAPPMLLVNAEHDAVTPLSNAKEMKSALDNGSHLLKWTGRGHGVVLQSKCSRETIGSFMMDPNKPLKSTTCGN